MAELLAPFLRDRARRPFAWGDSDCAMFLADWVEASTGTDPAAHLRGRYADDAGADALAPDGLGAIVADCAERAKLVPTDTPEPGDIAVLRGPGGDVCAIRTATGWAMRGRRHIVILEPARITVLRAWSIG